MICILKPGHMDELRVLCVLIQDKNVFACAKEKVVGKS